MNWCKKIYLPRSIISKPLYTFRTMSTFVKEQISVNSKFCSGNGDLVGINGNVVDVKIRDEPFTQGEQKQHKQWFHFRVSGVKETEIIINIVNAGDVSFPEAYSNYNVCASYDRKYWFRTPTTYDEKSGIMSWKMTPTNNQIYFAYFAPYSLQQHYDLIGKCVASKECSVKSLGDSLDGRSIDYITMGTGPKKLWAIGRQHPGETQAEWWMEGLINRLLDPADAISRHILKHATVHIVPNMNPDGSTRGHLRTNACGANLNREWANSTSLGEVYIAPSLERSPEVYHVLKQLDSIGCDFFVDVHGDEELPYNFLSGSEGCKVWSPRLEKLQNDFGAAYIVATPDFQVGKGYDIDEPNQANPSMCSNQIAERFDCLSFTLEMPYKDTIDMPDNTVGWSAERSMNFGAAILTPIYQLLDQLR